jgi:L-lactate utilization protein LutB
MEQEVIDSKWAWVCTLCGRCQYQCPMGIQLLKTFRACRTAREAGQGARSRQVATKAFQHKA